MTLPSKTSTSPCKINLLVAISSNWVIWYHCLSVILMTMSPRRYPKHVLNPPHSKHPAIIESSWEIANYLRLGFGFVGEFCGNLRFGRAVSFVLPNALANSLKRHSFRLVKILISIYLFTIIANIRNFVVYKMPVVGASGVLRPINYFECQVDTAGAIQMSTYRVYVLRNDNCAANSMECTMFWWKI